MLTSAHLKRCSMQPNIYFCVYIYLLFLFVCLTCHHLCAEQFSILSLLDINCISLYYHHEIDFFLEFPKLTLLFNSLILQYSFDHLTVLHHINNVCSYANQVYELQVYEVVGDFSFYVLAEKSEEAYKLFKEKNETFKLVKYFSISFNNYIFYTTKYIQNSLCKLFS